MNLRRRRLTIAALVLLMLGGGLWWSTRPKIDPRLVGTWIQRPHPDDKKGRTVFWTFNVDGTVQHSTEGKETPLDWEVRNGVLYVWHAEKIKNALDLSRFIDQHGRRISGSEVFGEYVLAFKILEVSQNELRTRCEPIPTFPPLEDVWTRD